MTETSPKDHRTVFVLSPWRNWRFLRFREQTNPVRENSDEKPNPLIYSLVTAQVVDLEDEKADQVTGQVTGQVIGQVIGQVKNPMERIVLAIGEKNLTRQEIMDALMLKGRDNFRVNYLEPSIRLGYVRMLYSGASNHPNQAYYLTKKGLKLYQSLNNK